tara:strand:- start:606 stop:911 length:306 start_codon:yes stop_codon:yes gene_type:complete
MNNKWKNYFSDRVMHVTSMGIKLIKPINIEIEVSSMCSICGFFMRGMEDVLSHEKYNCCQDCAYKWAQPNRSKWENGWRPTKSERQKHISVIMNQPTFRVR